MPDYFAQDAADLCSSLTPRQRDVLILSSKGLTRKGIAKALCLSNSTADTYLRETFKKLNVNSSQEAAVIAAKAGLV